MLTPPALQPGDHVGLLSTARAIDSDTIFNALELLRSWGLVPVIGKTIDSKHHQYAGDDWTRTKDLQHMLDTPEIKAIWCARGGYGTVRLLDSLNWEKFKTNPKWLIGYSDVTGLHSTLHNLNIESLHATMPIDLAGLKYSLGSTPQAMEAFKNALFGQAVMHKAGGHVSNITGQAKGQVVGGNLSILYSMCGSPTALDTTGKILFIEDLDEYLYHIDRMMQNLKRNGMLNGLSGLIVGGMTKMHDNTIPFGKTAIQIVLDATKDCDYPICFDFPVGHITDNRPMIVGRKAQLNVTPQDVTLTYELSQ